MENAYSAYAGLDPERTFPSAHAGLGIPRVADFPC